MAEHPMLRPMDIPEVLHHQTVRHLPAQPAARLIVEAHRPAQHRLLPKGALLPLERRAQRKERQKQRPLQQRPARQKQQLPLREQQHQLHRNKKKFLNTPYDRGILLLYRTKILQMECPIQERVCNRFLTQICRIGRIITI